jgi:multidrug resistance efflux pump
MSGPLRPFRLVWLLGVLVLIVSAAGTAWLIKNPSGDTPPRAEDPALAREVVCFGHVDVEHGVVSLYPSQPGRVQDVLVEEGQKVARGKVLLQLDDSLPKLLRDQAQADLDAALSQEKEAEDNLKKQKGYKVAQQKAAIQAAEFRLAAAEAIRQRKEELFKANSISRTELDAASDLVLELKAVLEAERNKLRELDLLNPEAGITRARADVAAKRARLEQAKLNIKECQLVAPQDGKALRVLVGKGDMLGAMPKQPAILFCPEEDRIIRAEVEQEFAGRVAIDTPALIQDDTTTSDQWHGKVWRISDWYTHRRSILQEPLQSNDVRTLECLIKLDPPTPNQKPLRIGQRVRVLIGHGP